jgi:hypothetical protein
MAMEERGADNDEIRKPVVFTSERKSDGGHFVSGTVDGFVQF